jgi:hypothetical protein
MEWYVVEEMATARNFQFKKLLFQMQMYTYN